MSKIIEISENENSISENSIDNTSDSGSDKLSQSEIDRIFAEPENSTDHILSPSNIEDWDIQVNNRVEVLRNDKWISGIVQSLRRKGRQISARVVEEKINIWVIYKKENIRKSR